MTPADQQTARQSPLLARLGPPVQDKLLDGAVVLTAETGQTLFLQDDPAAAVFILLDGWVKLYRVAPLGAEAVVSVMTRGRSFGEAVALRSQPYPVSAEAITPARLLRLDAENAEIWLDGSSIAAGVKSLLGIDPKEDYNDKQARVQL